MDLFSNLIVNLFIRYKYVVFRYKRKKVKFCMFNTAIKINFSFDFYSLHLELILKHPGFLSKPTQDV